MCVLCKVSRGLVLTTSWSEVGNHGTTDQGQPSSTFDRFFQVLWRIWEVSLAQMGGGSIYTADMQMLVFLSRQRRVDCGFLGRVTH